MILKLNLIELSSLNGLYKIGKRFKILYFQPKLINL
jgi:hypothetical protein